MEDIFKFLMVAAVIVIGLINQYKKEAKKNAGEKPVVPIPDVDNPLPESWEDNTYGGYIPKSSQPKKPASAPRSFKKNTSVPDTQEEEESSEYAIHSAEEARKAIIWGEILQRKHF